MSLKELTIEHHRSAERSGFAKTLLSGSINPRLYYQYLLNQFYIYHTLEEAISEVKYKGEIAFPKSLYPIFRSKLISKDVMELREMYEFPADLPLEVSTIKYINYIEELALYGDYRALLAHVYVRHFGDLHGGQIIKKRIPGDGAMYEFDNPEELKSSLRMLLDDELAPEANKCFEYATALFEELHNGSLGISNRSGE